MYKTYHLQVLQLKDITFWYNPEVIPDEPRSDYFSTDSTLALKLQPCWQTVIGQVVARKMSDYEQKLTHGDILHCLVISVYSILSGKVIPFELEQRSLDLATERLYTLLKHIGIPGAIPAWTGLSEERKALQDDRHGFIVPRPSTSST